MPAPFLTVKIEGKGIAPREKSPFALDERASFEGKGRLVRGFFLSGLPFTPTCDSDNMIARPMSGIMQHSLAFIFEPKFSGKNFRSTCNRAQAAIL